MAREDSEDSLVDPRAKRGEDIEYQPRDNRDIRFRCAPGEHDFGTSRSGAVTCARCNIQRQTIVNWFDEH